ncbi:MAG: hypothetical protein HY518_00075 [Candidatus Aenigmarchaeota archaeon]|nr:hypothetical protein [Candidatus Aenigmarchaeota archaeon]
MDFQGVYQYYSREDVQEAILGLARGREVAGVFKTGSFGTRPNAMHYGNDILSLVKAGVIEFHASIERWSNPMGIKTDNYESLRTGWDIILDLDCESIEHGKVAAEVILDALGQHGIASPSVKFTGGTGFHIGIPWESIPKTIDYKPSQRLFPDVARSVGLYLREYCREALEKELLKRFKAVDLARDVKMPLEKITTETGIDPFKIVDIDPVLISPRHLFRMAYSLNRNSGLVSLPIDPKSVGGFRKERAESDGIKVDLKFLERGAPDEAEVLIAESLDWTRKVKEAEKRKQSWEAMDREIVKPVPEAHFPPCIQRISQGLADGRKRSIFIIINFLSSLKWGWDEIEKYIIEWNLKNSPPLPESYIMGQLRSGRARQKPMLPPNCLNQGYYQSVGVCMPDALCRGGGESIAIKNPVNYSRKKFFGEARPRGNIKRRAKG